MSTHAADRPSTRSAPFPESPREEARRLLCDRVTWESVQALSADAAREAITWLVAARAARMVTLARGVLGIAVTAAGLAELPHTWWAPVVAVLAGAFTTSLSGPILTARVISHARHRVTGARLDADQLRATVAVLYTAPAHRSRRVRFRAFAGAVVAYLRGAQADRAGRLTARLLVRAAAGTLRPHTDGVRLRRLLADPPRELSCRALGRHLPAFCPHGRVVIRS